MFVCACFGAALVVLVSCSPTYNAVAVTEMWFEIKGSEIVVDFNKDSVKFTAGGSKRYVIKEFSNSSSESIGMVMVNGIVRFADNSEAYCLLKISELDSGELYSVGVFLPNGEIVFSRQQDFVSSLQKTREQVFPFRYKYTVPINCDDVHVGADGWSFSTKKTGSDKLAVALIGGLSFHDLCPGTNEDRLHLMNRQFAGTAAGYQELLMSVKKMRRGGRYRMQVSRSRSGV